MRTIRRTLHRALPLAGVLGLVGCGNVVPDDRIVVAVPVNPLAGLVEALAPVGAVEPLVLVPPGANPATHQPSTDQLRRFAVATAYLEIGHPAFPLERAWLDGLLAGSDARRVAIFADCDPLPEDPHVWTSPTCLHTAATRVAELLIQVMPAQRDEIESNLVQLDRRLTDVAATAESVLDLYRGRSLFVLHPAWGYLLRDYDIVQISILSHGTGPPGASRLAQLIEQGRAQGIRTIYVQPEFNARSAELVAEELGAEVVSLDPLARDPVALIERTVAALAEGFRKEVTDGD